MALTIVSASSSKSWVFINREQISFVCRVNPRPPLQHSSPILKTLANLRKYVLAKPVAFRWSNGHFRSPYVARVQDRTDRLVTSYRSPKTRGKVGARIKRIPRKETESRDYTETTYFEGAIVIQIGWNYSAAPLGPGLALVHARKWLRMNILLLQSHASLPGNEFIRRWYIARGGFEFIEHLSFLPFCLSIYISPFRLFFFLPSFSFLYLCFIFSSITAAPPRTAR